MEGVGLALIAIIVIVVVATSLRRQRKRAAELDLEDRSWLKMPETDEDPLSRHAPLREFHVHGNEARVTFDVPLPDQEDEVLNDLLLDEAVEVVREKRHTLPIEDVTEIVVFAGRGEPVQVGRTSLPSPGELPPPAATDMLNLTHIAKDPFASQFEVDHTVQYETKVSVPKDDLGPLRDDLRIPKGIDRGLRARGIDPDALSGPDFVLALLELFDYTVHSQEEPGLYLANKGNLRTFIRTEIHGPGTHPELDESVIRKFVVEFGTSGADRGLLISDKFGPYLAHDVEKNEPRVRFVTRERTQRFIDSMALG